MAVTGDKIMNKESTLHLVYAREYYDADQKYDYYFYSYYTIFRNVPLSQLNRINNKSFKVRVKEFCDKNYKETASNFTGKSKVEMITGDEYYRTYGEEFGKVNAYDEKHLLEDYGQLYNTRQFFKYDFNQQLTEKIIKENTINSYPPVSSEQGE